MSFNQFVLPISVWLIQTVAAVLLIIGFVALAAYLRQQVLENQHRDAPLYRLARLLVPVVLAGAFVTIGGVPFLANVAVSLMILLLFNEDDNQWDYVVRAVSVVGIWWLLHSNHLQDVRNLGLLAILLVTLLGVSLFRKRMRYSGGVLAGISLCFMVSFWFTFQPRLDWQPALMYLITSDCILYYWLQAHQRLQLNREIQALTQYDDLSNATANEHSRHESNRLFATAKAQQVMLIAVALDVDQFKQFNQDYGHMTGNAALIAITRRLTQVLNAADLTYHLYHTGGEEFSIIFPKATLAQVTALITSCLANVRQQPVTVDVGQVTLTLSAGITMMQVTDQTMDAVYQRADDNLYLSKQRGRDVVTAEGVTAESDHDVDVNQLAYFAQPIEQVTDATTTHWAAELLLRRYDKNHDQWRLPNRFDISVENQVTLMRTALAGLKVQQVTLNLTLAQFSDSDTATTLAAFMKSGQGPARLVIEIIEVPTLAILRRVSALYRDAGIAIYIDDVGSDNSFELVRKLLPYVNGVKFAIQNLRKTETQDRIQERILFWLDVAKERQIDFILEGVETQAEVAHACDLGITHFQGYYFDKPHLPAVV